MGVAVESENEPGSVQIYPVAALTDRFTQPAVPDPTPEPPPPTPFPLPRHSRLRNAFAAVRPSQVGYPRFGDPVIEALPSGDYRLRLRSGLTCDVPKAVYEGDC